LPVNPYTNGFRPLYRFSFYSPHAGALALNLKRLGPQGFSLSLLTGCIFR
jgi:hypothetical protein